MIREIGVKIANTNEAEFFEVSLETVEAAYRFVKNHYEEIYGEIDISKPYINGDDEVVFKIEYFEEYE